jgi:hypothetical protein
MTLKWRVLLGVAVVVVGLGARGVAHHGQAGLFDETRTVELKGSVKTWSFVNPHPILVLQVSEKGTTAEWDVYFGPSAVSFLRRQGYTSETFRVGETLVIQGHPATGTGVRGIDVWGKGTGVTRADGTAVPK